MNKIIFVLLLMQTIVVAQDLNKMVIEEPSGKPLVIGLCDRTVFADTNFSWWYNPEYNNYKINSTPLDSIKDKLDDVKIKIVFGTWCSDSRREVPRFLKILDSLNFNSVNIKMICVDRDKNAEGTEVKDLDIKYVPTFIIYKDDEEIGRIIEEPKVTLEEDLLSFLLTS